MDGLTLLNKARAAGLTVEAHGNKLSINGPKTAGAVAKELLDHKAAVLAALASGSATRPTGHSAITPVSILSFHTFIGHKHVVELLDRQIAGALARGQPCPHTLITGASGLGKTLLAETMASEYGTKLVMAIGETSKVELVNKLIGLEANDFLLIDESQSLKGPVQELLYEAIDHRRVPRIPKSLAVDAPGDENDTTVTIPPFTVVLATDQPGRLLNALQKRMALRVSLNYYPPDELKQIVDRMAKDMNLLLCEQAAILIAKVSAGLPRRVKHHLQNLQNHFPESENQQISDQQVKEFLAAFDIDDKGLGAQEHQYLDYLRTGSASLESLAIHVGLDSDYVRRQIEPLLLRKRFVTIGSGGRRLTPEGQEWIQQTNSITQDRGKNGQS